MQRDRYLAARPHLIRAFVGLVIAIFGFIIAKSGQLKRVRVDGVLDPSTDTEKLLAIIGALVLAVGGVLLVRTTAAAIRAAAGAEEVRRAGPLAFLVSAIGYVFLLLAVLGALDIGVEKVLLGGALTGVILGIAAQQSLGNFFAGIVLLMARPFSVGDRIGLRSGPLGGPYEGLITEMTMFYVHMATDEGVLLLPNAGVLAAAVGPAAAALEVDKPEGAKKTDEVDPGTAQGGTPAGP